jgi:hypothetical protein
MKGRGNSPAFLFNHNEIFTRGRGPGFCRDDKRSMIHKGIIAPCGRYPSKQVWRLWAIKKAGCTLIATGFGGERGIRTPGALAGTTVFKTAAIDHSAISPGCKAKNFS